MNSIMTVLVFYVRHNNFWKQFLETVCCSQKMNRKLWFAITRTFRKQKTSLTVLLSVSFLSVTWPRYCLVNTPLASLCTHQQPIIVNPKHLSTPTSTWIEEKSHTGEVWSFEIDTHPRSPYIPVLVCKCLFTWLLCPQCPPRPRPGVPMCRRTHYADLSPQSCYVTGWVNLESSGVTVWQWWPSVSPGHIGHTGDTDTWQPGSGPCLTHPGPEKGE